MNYDSNTIFFSKNFHEKIKFLFFYKFLSQLQKSSDFQIASKIEILKKVNMNLEQPIYRIVSKHSNSLKKSAKSLVWK